MDIVWSQKVLDFLIKDVCQAENLDETWTCMLVAWNDITKHFIVSFKNTQSELKVFQVVADMGEIYLDVTDVLDVGDDHPIALLPREGIIQIAYVNDQDELVLEKTIEDKIDKKDN